MKGFLFERALVELVSEISLKKGIKAKPLAEKACPNRKDAGTKWRKIRNGDPPQELSVRDAYDLACAMGISITDLCGAAQTKVLGMDLTVRQQPEEKNTAQGSQKIRPKVTPIEVSPAYKN